MTTATRLTTDNIEAGYDDDKWQGFGYLGAREGAIQSIEAGEWNGDLANIAAADQAVLDHANAKGWSTGRLFAFLNGRAGRHFADTAFGGPADLALAISWGLLDKTASLA